MNLRRLFLRFSPVTLAGVLVLSIALTLYLCTLDNGVRLEELKGGDLITHQYAQVQARPSNAPPGNAPTRRRAGATGPPPRP